MILSKSLALAAAGLVFATVQSANALTLTVEDVSGNLFGVPSPTTVLTDAATPGSVVFNPPFGGPFGDFTLLSVFGTSSADSLNLSFTAISNPAAPSATEDGADPHQLRLTLQEDNLSFNLVNPFSVFADFTSGGFTFGEVDIAGFLSINGGAFEEIGEGEGDGGPIIGADVERFALAPTDTFSLRIVADVSHDSKFDQTVNGAANINVSPVPIPATLPLILSALLGLGLIGRRRARAG